MKRIQTIYGGITKGPSLAYTIHMIGSSMCKEVNLESIEPVVLDSETTIEDVIDRKTNHKFMPSTTIADFET